MTTPGQPTFDLVVPAFNPRPEWLDAALASALPCPGLARIILIDDGSSPSIPTPPPPAPPAPELHLIRQPNAGPSAARNLALAQLRADFALLLDADDTLIPAGVASAVRLATSLNAAAAVSAREELRPDGSSRSRPVPPEWADRPLPRPDDVFRPIALFGASGLLVHRRLIDAGLRFDESLRIGEDRDFLRRAAALGSIAVSSHAALRVRLHDNAANLTSPHHLARRVQDHITLLDRWHSPESAAHLREATLWLLGALARAGAPNEPWHALTAAAARRGWPIPLKARLRRLLAARRP